MPEISTIRKILHQYPELSSEEYETAKRIKSYLNKLQPTKIIEQLGGTGLAAIYEFSSSGPTIMIRCELDALPILENPSFEYKSKNQGVSHKCGHDGHMTILLQLCLLLNEKPFTNGKVVLLFQPAEETGKGAQAVLQDSKFDEIRPDYVFALHNIPGAPLHEIIKLETGFSAEVESFSLHLVGKTSHAAEPQNGINPAFGIANLIPKLTELIVDDPNSKDFAILTPVHINVGEKSYGVSPDKGEIHYTMRTWNPKSLASLKLKIQDFIEDVTATENLTYSLQWFEHFPASENDPACNQFIETAAIENRYSLNRRDYPFTFGEDFGWFSKTYKCGMFGLGAGLHTPPLHHEDYDFPDEIIETGAQMFFTIIGQILKA